jgi:hypothetical protein
MIRKELFWLMVVCIAAIVIVALFDYSHKPELPDDSVMEEIIIDCDEYCYDADLVNSIRS